MYGSTDDIVADVRSGTHFMGEAFTTSTAPVFNVRLFGTAPFQNVVVIKNNNIVYSTSGDRLMAFSWQDQARPGDQLLLRAWIADRWKYRLGQSDVGDDAVRGMWTADCGGLFSRLVPMHAQSVPFSRCMFHRQGSLSTSQNNPVVLRGRQSQRHGQRSKHRN